jgi:hypothetical protein
VAVGTTTSALEALALETFTVLAAAAGVAAAGAGAAGAAGDFLAILFALTEEVVEDILNALV